MQVEHYEDWLRETQRKAPKEEPEFEDKTAKEQILAAVAKTGFTLVNIPIYLLERALFGSPWFNKGLKGDLLPTQLPKRLTDRYVAYYIDFLRGHITKEQFIEATHLATLEAVSK